MLTRFTGPKTVRTIETEKLKSFILWSAFGFLAYLAVFKLPFLFPPSVPTLSASYSAGFNNRVASIAAVLFGITAFAIARRRLEPVHQPCVRAYRVPTGALWMTLLVHGSVLTIASVCVSQSPHSYGEAWYFLNRLDQIAIFGNVPFSDFEFAYGPLLLYLPALVHWIGTPLHLSIEWSYYFGLTVLSLTGVYGLFWTVNELIPGRHYKLIVFGLFALGLNPTMGMNGMYFRFIGPYVALLLAERFDGWQRTFAFLSIASLLLFSISPEIGFAYSVGASGLSICRSLSGGAQWLACVIGAWVGPLLLLAVFGSGYLQTFSAFSKGAQNFVIVPVPHILLFLVGLIFIIPLGAGRIPSSHWRENPALIGMLLCSVVLVPAALGRCDFGHVFLDGLGIILLSLRFTFSFRGPVRIIWLGLISIVFLHGVLTGFRFYARAIIPVIGAGVRAYAPPAESFVTKLIPGRLHQGFTEPEKPPMHTARALGALGRASVAMPFGADKRMTRILQESHVYAPSFFAGLTNVFDAEAESRSIEDVDKKRWALIPRDIYLPDENIDFVRRVFSFSVRYPYLRELYRPGKRLLAHIDSKWIKRESIDGFWLYCNKTLGACPPVLSVP
jgi:hypothetical protein